MKPRRTVLRVIALLLAWGAAGAALNVAVAWGCAVWSAGSELYDDSIDYFHAPRVADKDRRWLKPFEPPNARPGFDWSSGELIVFGFRRITFYWLPDYMFSDYAGKTPGMLTGSFSGLVGVTKAGWPCLAMTSHDLQVDDDWGGPPSCRYFKAFPVQIEVDFGGGPDLLARPIPCLPLWPGFAINTVFYAGVLWVLCCGPFALRRMIRRRRGRCARCAYPIGQSPDCTECGASVMPATPKAGIQ